MKINDKIKFLKTIDFLAGVSLRVLEEIGDQLREIAMSQGSEIFSDGSPGDAMYFIFAGEVFLKKKNHLLLSRGKGEYVGEMALIDDGGRSAGAVCASDVRLLCWEKDDFRGTLIANGRIAYQVCKAFSTKIRESVESATRFKQDLEHAIQLQRAMLPKVDFSNDLVSLAAYCSQAEEIGGDYYDYLIFDDNRLALFVADAQGHGYSAALVVAMLKARLYGQARIDRSPEQMMSALNDTLFESITDVQMVPCCYILVDGTSKVFHYCSAGHVSQFHYRADVCSVDALNSTSLILGFKQQGGDDYRVETRSWSPGDYIILCTDGVLEAKNAMGVEFGADRLVEAIKAASFTEPRAIQETLCRALKEYCGTNIFEDDVTLVAVRLQLRRQD